jgi:hypothetical protein
VFDHWNKRTRLGFHRVYDDVEGFLIRPVVDVRLRFSTFEKCLILAGAVKMPKD